MTWVTDRPASAAPKRRRVFGLIVFLVVIGLAWSGLWGVARYFGDTAFDKVLAAERTRGRVWDCADRQISGFPFSFKLICAQPSFAGEISGRKVVGTAAALRATVHLYRPTEVIADLDAPLDLKSQDGVELLNAGWKHLRLNANLGLSGVDNLAIAAEEPQIEATSPGSASVAAQATLAHVNLTPAAGRPAADGAFDLALDLTGAEIPSLDQWIGSSNPVDVSAAGTLSEAHFMGSGSLAERLEKWRAAGGRLDINRSSIVKGGSRIEATGSLDIDPDHRPHGHIDASASGLEPVLTRLGLPSGAVALTGFVAGLFGPAPAKASPAGAPAGRGIPLPVKIEDGAVMVGPVKTKFQLRPLY